MAGTYTPVTTVGPRAPHLARTREDVTSRTPLHLRERVQYVRCWIFEHPRRVNMAIGGGITLAVEHHVAVAAWVAETAATASAAWTTVSGWF